MPRVSVVIPAYNAEKTIRETVESVLNQTFSDLEIIVINDTSQDTTLEVVQGMQDPRIKVFTYKGGSASASRNRGISHSSGEFIAFLDSDDLWTPEKLEMQLKALEENPDAAVAYSWVNRVDSSGQSLGLCDRSDRSGNIYFDMLLSNFLHNGSNPLIRQDALAKIGNFDESLPNAEDWDMYLRLAENYQFTVVPYPHVLYRVSYQSKSFRNLLRSEASVSRVMAKACKRRPEATEFLVEKTYPGYYKYVIEKALKNPINGWKAFIVFTLFWRYLIKSPGQLKNLRLKLSLFFLILSGLGLKLGIKTWILVRFKQGLSN